MLRNIKSIKEKLGIVISLKMLQEGLCIKWCGYMLRVIDAEGPLLIEPDSERLKVVTEFPSPMNRTELRKFLSFKMQVQAWIPILNWIYKELHQLTLETMA